MTETTIILYEYDLQIKLKLCGKLFAGENVNKLIPDLFFINTHTLIYFHKLVTALACSDSFQLCLNVVVLY